MAKRKKKEKTASYSCTILFQKTLEKKKERESAFSKFLSLLEENKKSFPVEVSSNKQKRRIVLEGKNYILTFSCGKHPSMKIIVNAPERNKIVANEATSRIVNYMNTILGEVATGARVMSMKTIVYHKKTVNLAEKIIGMEKIVKINELLKQTWKPLSIGFEYKVGKKDFMFSTFFGEDGGLQVLMSNIVYKDKIPFNLLEKEIAEFADTEEAAKKLVEMEL